MRALRTVLTLATAIGGLLSVGSSVRAGEMTFVNRSNRPVSIANAFFIPQVGDPTVADTLTSSSGTPARMRVGGWNTVKAGDSIRLNMPDHNGKCFIHLSTRVAPNGFTNKINFMVHPRSGFEYNVYPGVNKVQDATWRDPEGRPMRKDVFNTTEEANRAGWTTETFYEIRASGSFSIN
jgi:hypothetical protein